MKKTIVSAAFLSISLGCFAQDATVRGLQTDASKTLKSLEKDGWHRSGSFILNVNQGSLQNWVAGGEQNTLGINGLLNYTVSFRKGKNTWDNYFDLGLGFQNATSFNKYRKTDDHIDITTKYGYELSKKWYAALLANFNTQSLPGYTYTDTTNTKISNFLTPGKVLLSAGFDFRPNTELSIFISPLTTRWILKKDADFYKIPAFGVDSGRKSYNEVGAYITAKYNKPLSKWATYTGRLDLFSNYKRNPQNVDVYFTNLLTMKFNKWLGAAVSLNLVYDDDVLKKTQLQEIFGLGLTLKL